MPILRIEYGVADFDEWKQLFDSDPADRKGAGVRSYRILRPVEDPNYVLIDLQFDSADDATAFLEQIRTIWSGTAAEIVRNPNARLVEAIEIKEL